MAGAIILRHHAVAATAATPPPPFPREHPAAECGEENERPQCTGANAADATVAADFDAPAAAAAAALAAVVGDADPFHFDWPHW